MIVNCLKSTVKYREQLVVSRIELESEPVYE